MAPLSGSIGAWRAGTDAGARRPGDLFRFVTLAGDVVVAVPYMYGKYASK